MYLLSKLTALAIHLLTTAPLQAQINFPPKEQQLKSLSAARCCLAHTQLPWLMTHTRLSACLGRSCSFLTCAAIYSQAGLHFFPASLAACFTCFISLHFVFSCVPLACSHWAPSSLQSKVAFIADLDWTYTLVMCMLISSCVARVHVAEIP